MTEAFCDSTAQRDLGNFKVSLWKRGYIVFRFHWIKSYRKSGLQCVCEKSCSGVEGGDDHILKLVSLPFVPQPLLHPGEMIEGLKMRRCRIMDTKGGRVSEGWASRMGRGWGSGTEADISQNLFGKMREKDKGFDCCVSHIIIYATHGCLKIKWTIFYRQAKFYGYSWTLDFVFHETNSIRLYQVCSCVCVFRAFLFVPLFFLSQSLQFSSATFLWWKSCWPGPYRDYLLRVWPMLRMFTSTQVCVIVRVSCRIRRVSGMELGHSACIWHQYPRQYCWLVIPCACSVKPVWANQGRTE